MAKVEPYTISIPQPKIDRLNRKLRDFISDEENWPHEIQGADDDWQYGSPVKDIKRIANHWLNTFSWRSTEKQLNALPNFTTTVNVEGFGDIPMHFLHQESGNANAIPLLFVHGWPGSFLEVTKMLPLLKGGEGRPTFSVVAPSLVNYGFSGGCLKKGFAIKQYAEACHKVMLALGHDQYVTQGGDWGFLITRALAHLYPAHVKAHHVNWAYCGKPEFTTENPEPEYSEREKKQLALGEKWNPFGTGEGRGYIAIQSTRPTTINYAFRDSPIALLAWIWDKMVDWTDDYPWTDEEVCLWLSIYVFSTSGPDASSYIYYEAIHDTTSIPLPVTMSYIDVPLGISDFPVELANSPSSWRHTMGPIKQMTYHDKGGHFAGWERPDALAGDLCRMFGRGGGCEGVVGGKSGY